MTRAETHIQYQEILREAKERGQAKAAYRELALKDLFFLLVYVLNRGDVDRDWLFDRCREVQANPDGYLDLWAREHYKSTIITYALTIQDILRDPEITVGIFSFTRPIAKAFLRQIKLEFEGNDELRSLFPEILWDNPQKQAPKWSEDDGIIVKRKSNPKEATVEAWGMIDSMPTSKHFTLMVFDDVVTDKSVSTPEMIEKVTDKWALALNLGAEGGRIRYIGTRYHYNDTYKTMIDRKAAIVREYPATDDGTADGVPVFMSVETLARKRRDMGPYIFACQMLQNPKQDDAQGFSDKWLRYWPAANTKGMNVYILVDPAGSKKKDNDYTVFTVLGMGADQNYYVVTWVRDRLNLSERAKVLFSLQRSYSPRGIFYEQYGLQADIEHFKHLMEEENYRFHIRPIGGPVPKVDRIRALVPIFEQGRIYIPDTCVKVNYQKQGEDLTKVFINDEYNAFPYCFHDDMLDCLARCLDPEFTGVFPQRDLDMHGLIEDRLKSQPYNPLRSGITRQDERGDFNSLRT